MSLASLRQPDLPRQSKVRWRHEGKAPLHAAQETTPAWTTRRVNGQNKRSFAGAGFPEQQPERDKRMRVPSPWRSGADHGRHFQVPFDKPSIPFHPYSHIPPSGIPFHPYSLPPAPPMQPPLPGLLSILSLQVRQHPTSPPPQFSSPPHPPPPLLSSLIKQSLVSAGKTDPTGIGVEFRQEMLKERRDDVINSLYSGIPRQCMTCGLRFKSQDDHSKHMDWHVHRNRTRARRKSGKERACRQWFLPLKSWIAGVVAEPTAPPVFAQQAQAQDQEAAANQATKEAFNKFVVPADYEQSLCALCGERLVDFFSYEDDEWQYRGAMYMVPPGTSTRKTIAHSQCFLQQPLPGLNA